MSRPASYSAADTGRLGSWPDKLDGLNRVRLEVRVDLTLETEVRNVAQASLLRVHEASSPRVPPGGETPARCDGQFTTMLLSPHFGSAVEGDDGFSICSEINQFSTFLRAQGVLRRKVRLDFTVGLN